MNLFKRKYLILMSLTGFVIALDQLTKYMARKGSLAGTTFLRYHANGIVAMDLFVPIMSFQMLNSLLIMGLWPAADPVIGVTARPTDEWIANQLTGACSSQQTPRYLIRRRDRACRKRVVTRYQFRIRNGWKTCARNVNR